MSTLDDKIFLKVRNLIEKFPRLKFMLPHLPIYIGGGCALFAYTLFRVLDPLPDYDKRVVPEKNKDS